MAFFVHQSEPQPEAGDLIKQDKDKDSVALVKVYGINYKFTNFSRNVNGTATKFVN